jgi:hypothetical protein
VTVSNQYASKKKKIIKVVRTKKPIIKYFEKSMKTVLVHFEDFYGPEAEEYNEFTISLASKKAYYKMIDIIVNENNTILNRNSELAQNFMYRYYSLKRNIDDNRYLNKDYTYFLSDLTGLFEIKFVEEIKKYVNENFKRCVGDIYDEDKKYEAGITFLDYHLKILYTISRMQRFIILICIQYIHMYPGTVDTNTFLVSAFMILFRLAQNYGYFDANSNEENSLRQTDVYQKLYMFIQRKVEKTLQTDKVMWERQAFLGVNPKSAIEDILNKLITNIMPEYSFKSLIMNLNAVMIKTTVTQYILRKKDPFNINQLVDSDIAQVDDDSVTTEAEIFDSYNSKRNEMTLFIRKLTVDDTIDKIIIRNNVTITPEEFEFYHRTNKIQTFQQFAIFQTFFSYFGGTENIYSCNKINYTKLLVILIKMLDTVETPELIKYITGERTRHFINKRESRSLHTTIVNDPVYKNIIETKYKSTQNILIRNNFIENKVLFLINNEFLYNNYNSLKNGMPIEKDESEILSSVLKFFSRLIM